MKTILIIIGVVLVLLIGMIGYACIGLETSLQFRQQRRGTGNGSMGA